ncbi:MAG: sulfotransferase, partial [Nitrososphaera sp.]
MLTEKEIWPNFFIVGAQKCGTTSMYYYLKDVPGVFMCPVKEPNHFAPNVRETVAIDVIRDKREYLDLFRKADGNIAIGEASVFYLWDPDAPRLIRQTVPNAKIIIMLRDPIERAFSQ